MEGFLYGCGLPEAEHAVWLNVWDALKTPRNPVTPIVSEDPVAAIEAAVRQAVVDAAVGLGCPPAWASGSPRRLGDVVGYAQIARVALNIDEVESIVTYFASPDFRQLLTQIALLWSPTLQLQGEGLSSALRDQLLHGLRHATGLLASGSQVARLERVAEGLLTVLNEPAVRAVFDLAPRSSVVHDLARATATANAHLLASAHRLRAFHDFGNRMRARVAAVHAEIRLPHTGQNRSVGWNDLHVPPELAMETLTEFAWDDHELWRPARHTVILGDPGAGKSTFAAKLAYDVATSADDDRRSLVPFLVVLRDLSIALAHGDRSIVDHLLAVCRAPYHVTASIEAIEYVLLNGRALIILDGLDELADVGLRARVVRLIEGFVAAYPATPVVVTSRRIGYLETPLPQSVFFTFVIAGFTPEKVKAYAVRWFALDDGSPQHTRKALAASFLRESGSIDDLRRNPLLLSLLCAMYAAEHFIPANRAQIYERCALMIFERWDRMRQLAGPRQFQGEVRTAVQRLAWQLLTGGGSTEMPKPLMLRLLVRHLVGKGYEEDEAEPMAEGFLEFCAGRAWVLEAMGTAGTEPVYGFAHRTFLEFFAAEFLVRNHPVPAQVWAELSPRVSDASWEVVGQLALQLLERNIIGGADQLVVAALDAIPDAEPPRRGAIAAFVGRALQHEELSPPVVTRIVNVTVDEVLSLPVAERIVAWSAADRASEAKIADTPLQNMLERSLETNLRSVRRALVDRLAAETAADNEAALLLTERLVDWPHPASEVRAEVCRHSREAFERWRERVPWNKLDNRGHDPAALVEILDRFGAEALYRQHLILGVGRPPGWTGPFRMNGRSPSAIDRLGVSLMNCARPWVPWTAAPVASQLMFLPVAPEWVPDGPGLATLAILALPYLEYDSRLFRLAPHGRDLIEALDAARRATILAQKVVNEEVNPFSGLDSEREEAERRREQLVDAARSAVAACEELLREARISDTCRQFLGRWIRNEFRLTFHKGEYV
ncbi:NACHT domain-containing protein [Micromonospora chalcea]